MALFFIAYDLDKPGQNYKAVHALLKKMGAKRVLESTWALREKSSTTKILKAIAGEDGPFDANDRVIVIEEADWTTYHPITDIKDV